jgi:predicted small metal-binding protein
MGRHNMAKVLNCRDLGTDCDFVARGETVEELMQVGAKHGAEVHGMTEIPPEMAQQIMSLSRDE